MPSLTFGLIQSNDAAILQQLAQNTQLSGGPLDQSIFGQAASTMMIARSNGRIVGFSCGHKGYGHQSSVFTIHGTVLCQNVNTPEIKNDLLWALISYAGDNLKVTQYKLEERGDIKNIADGKPQISETPKADHEYEDDDMPYQEQVTTQYYEPRRAYG